MISMRSPPAVPAPATMPVFPATRSPRRRLAGGSVGRSAPCGVWRVAPNPPVPPVRTRQGVSVVGLASDGRAIAATRRSRRLFLGRVGENSAEPGSEGFQRRQSECTEQACSSAWPLRGPSSARTLRSRRFQLKHRPPCTSPPRPPVSSTASARSASAPRLPPRTAVVASSSRSNSASARAEGAYWANGDRSPGLLELVVGRRVAEHA